MDVHTHAHTGRKKDSLVNQRTGSDITSENIGINFQPPLINVHLILVKNAV